MLAAIFTTRPIAVAENNIVDVDDKPSSRTSTNRMTRQPEDITDILAKITLSLPKILVEPDRILAAANTISTNLIAPSIKAKTFPLNMTKSLLVLIYHVSRLPGTQKSWKKDVGDAFNDSRFFANSLQLAETDWLPLLRQWVQSDKDKMPDIASKLTSPTTAGIVFGVGASSAKLEADRKTQLTLRRMTTLVLATIDDNFAGDLALIHENH